MIINFIMATIIFNKLMDIKYANNQLLFYLSIFIL